VVGTETENVMQKDFQEGKKTKEREKAEKVVLNLVRYLRIWEKTAKYFFSVYVYRNKVKKPKNW